ncbi:MAG TPA: hypothetical protein PKB10_00455, partial [Tepidisphaeraceae bacterium]|nr:hypothetical protein [Tepidisphaeraceae bacterium]
MRVFLHDLLYRHDRDGFFHRFDRFLDASIAHGITIMPVFFDSCWHPFPSLGPQRPPEPGVRVLASSVAEV